MSNKLTPKQIKALFFIRDGIVYRGQAPSLRDISTYLGFSSPRSASMIIESLTELGYLKRSSETGNLQLIKDITGKDYTERTIEIPLVGSVACGAPLLAEENIEAMIPVSQKIARPGATYFILRADGDSMNKVIKDGDLAIVRQQPVAENGQMVVALIDDKATLKEFYKTKDHIILRPNSTKKEYEDIILDSDFFIQGVVISIIKNQNSKKK
jgi:repressor LexA